MADNTQKYEIIADTIIHGGLEVNENIALKNGATINSQQASNSNTTININGLSICKTKDKNTDIACDTGVIGPLQIETDKVTIEGSLSAEGAIQGTGLDVGEGAIKCGSIESSSTVTIDEELMVSKKITGCDNLQVSGTIVCEGGSSGGSSTETIRKSHIFEFDALMVFGSDASQFFEHDFKSDGINQIDTCTVALSTTSPATVTVSDSNGKTAKAQITWTRTGTKVAVTASKQEVPNNFLTRGLTFNVIAAVTQKKTTTTEPAAAIVADNGFKGKYYTPSGVDATPTFTQTYNASLSGLQFIYFGDE